MPNPAPSLASRVAAWRHAWLLELIAIRAVDAPQAIQERLALWLLLRSAVVQNVRQPRWEEVRKDLRSHRGQAISEFFVQDDALLIVDATAADAIARDLKIDLRAEWLRLQAEPKGIQLYEFLDLHRADELNKLASVWKLTARGNRAERIKAIVGQMRNVPLPAVIRPTTR